MDINLVAPINQLGYGVAGYNILASLIKSGHSVALFPIGGVTWPSSDESNNILSNATKASTMFNASAPSVRIWHQFEMDMFPGGGLRVGFPIFELDKFTDREKHHLSSLDAIFVCSEWAKKVILDNGVITPTFIVPLGVDVDKFFYNPEGLSNRQYWNKTSTIFMNVGKWEVRKGHNELLAAFNAAFSPNDNVELWMMNDNPFIGAENFEWRKKYALSAMGNRVKFFDRIDNHAEMRKLFEQVDCGVFPAKAEGFNLEPLEMMACGAHIIATNYSGHTAYMNDKNASLLDVTGQELAQDGKWFNGQGSWATFDIEQLVEKLRNMHEAKQNGSLSINTAGIETAKMFTWENTTKKMASYLELMSQ